MDSTHAPLEHSDGLQNTDITILQLISEFGALQGLLRMSPSTDLSVKMQPHKFANGIAFAAGHIN